MKIKKLKKELVKKIQLWNKKNNPGCIEFTKELIISLKDKDIGRRPEAEILYLTKENELIESEWGDGAFDSPIELTDTDVSVENLNTILIYLKNKKWKPFIK